MKRLLVFLMLVLFNSANAMPVAEIPIHPNEKVTPGDYCDEEDKDFVDFRYVEHMAYCKRNVSGHLKAVTYKKYGVPEECKHRYTVDHLVPLSLGGNNSPENLWPEHVLVKQTRQQLEQELFDAVSKGKMKSEDAVEELLEAKKTLHLDLSYVDGCG